MYPQFARAKSSEVLQIPTKEWWSLPGLFFTELKNSIKRLSDKWSDTPMFRGIFGQVSLNGFNMVIIKKGSLSIQCEMSS
jgi:hypothetical protein